MKCTNADTSFFPVTLLLIPSSTTLGMASLLFNESSSLPAVITLLSDTMGGTVKIFKKCSPNGRVYLYLGNREFVSCDGAIPPITGIVNIQDHHDRLKELYTPYGLAGLLLFLQNAFLDV